jgi:adenylylsulfate kinase
MKGSSFAVWVTGIPSSGKSSIAKALIKLLHEEDIPTQILETDEIRERIISSPTYTLEERDIIYRVMILSAEYLTAHGVSVILAATGYKRKYREEARRRLPNYVEAYVKCSLETAMNRDSKGLYARARAGEIQGLPGLQDEYEEPTQPDITLDSEREPIDVLAEKIFVLLKNRGLVNLDPGEHRLDL